MQSTITCADLRILLDRNEPTTLLDLRRADDRAKEPLAIPAAVWHEPAAIDDWSAKLSKVDEVILYCVRGGSVSNLVVDALHAKGFKARFIEGGLEAWKQAGGATEPQP